MNMVEPGYYTLQDRYDNEIAVALVKAGDAEVFILNYTEGWTVEQVFGANSIFVVLAGPWQPPLSKRGKC